MKGIQANIVSNVREKKKERKLKLTMSLGTCTAWCFKAHVLG